jgi:geranylgeranyl reductase family protein
MPLNVRIRPACDTDIIIAGGGPAGSATAIHLARAGIGVIVLEKARFPRDKICGDFVGPVGLVELDALGVGRSHVCREAAKIHRAALFCDGEPLIEHDFPGFDGLPRFGRMIARRELDHVIIEQAANHGARIIWGAELRTFKADDHGVGVHFLNNGRFGSLRGRLLIGADGSLSRVARLLRGHGLRSSDRITAVRTYAVGLRRQAAPAELYFNSSSFPGYCWCFPMSKGRANVGLGMASEMWPRPGLNLKTRLRSFIETDPALARFLEGARLELPIRGWPLATYNPRLANIGPRVMLTGDAAGLINPLNGEGIQYALLSGRLAAAVALDCLKQDDLSAAALRPYDQMLKQQLGYDMALGRMIVQLIRNRALNPVWLSALRIITRQAEKDPAYARLAGGILSGAVPARHALGLTVLGGTAMGAIDNIVVSPIIKSLREPGSMLSAGVAASAAGLRMLATLLDHPSHSLTWFGGVAARALELGHYALGDGRLRKGIIAPS